MRSRADSLPGTKWRVTDIHHHRVLEMGHSLLGVREIPCISRAALGGHRKGVARELFPFAHDIYIGRSEGDLRMFIYLLGCFSYRREHGIIFFGIM